MPTEPINSLIIPSFPNTSSCRSELQLATLRVRLLLERFSTSISMRFLFLEEFVTPISL